MTLERALLLTFKDFFQLSKDIFFKDTLTVPKVKDLIIQPEEKYKNIEIITREEEGTTNINDLKQTSTKPITNDDNDMKKHRNCTHM